MHWFTEAGRLAYADRNLYVADSDFVDVPVKGLLDQAYLQARANMMSDSRLVLLKLERLIVKAITSRLIQALNMAQAIFPSLIKMAMRSR